jgi:ubiquinone/menaquinone biosynthesis C-methylase UbiE
VSPVISGEPLKAGILAVEHFTQVSEVYNDVRTTDIEPVRLVRQRLCDRDEIAGADIGIGAGRYSYLLLREIRGLHLTCVDYNHAMLCQADCLLRNLDRQGFELVRADGGGLPFTNGSFDCMLTFNAIHHLDLSSFLQEAARLLKESGLLFIYTRLLSQNENTIWGQHFPDFTAVERRLYDLGQLRLAIENTPSLELESVECFSYRRKAPLERLVAQATSHHYSTFSLYQPEHFERALTQFERNLQNAFPNGNRIDWTDENTMLVIRKDPSDPR